MLEEHQWQTNGKRAEDNDTVYECGNSVSVYQGWQTQPGNELETAINSLSSTILSDGGTTWLPSPANRGVGAYHAEIRVTAYARHLGGKLEDARSWRNCRKL